MNDKNSKLITVLQNIIFGYKKVILLLIAQKTIAFAT